ncbi:MAG TPA: radical SAM family heme chaperone HemW [Anaerolineales bacterium]|nr:radical SAM family heme chaperone HemW [Anaerolineales bacterium]
MDYSLYIHIPFCTHRCAYCDFNTYAGQGASIPPYVDALGMEIRSVGQRPASSRGGPARQAGRTVHTIFFGGGTPSLLSPDQFESILRSVRQHFSLTENAEITIEANPGTVDPGQLQRLRGLGINRISFGVQSANREELQLLERRHDFFDVIDSVSWAQAAGFENLNLDLIYGLPEQTLETWQRTVEQILKLNPSHISAYALTLEHGTPFGRWSARGLLPLPDPDLAAEMYEWASEVFESSGYHQYEISNWAKRDHECLHNLQYWRGLPYLGFGAGAHGYAHGYRYSNVLRIKTYIDRLATAPADTAEFEFPLSSATVNYHRQTPGDDMSEYMLTGLRLTREGIDPAAFRSRFGCELKDVYQREIDELIRLGLLEWHLGTSEVSQTSEVLRLTRRGRLLGNRVFMRFVN